MIHSEKVSPFRVRNETHITPGVFLSADSEGFVHSLTPPERFVGISQATRHKGDPELSVIVQDEGKEEMHISDVTPGHHGQPVFAIAAPGGIILTMSGKGM